MEAVTPLEIVESSFRINEYEKDDNGLKRHGCLDLVDERRIKAQKRSTEYHKRIKKVIDRRVNPRSFNEGDLVLRSIQATGKPIGKLDPKLEGPFRVTKSCNNGAYKLETLQGTHVPRSWNIIHLKKFYH